MENLLLSFSFSWFPSPQLFRRYKSWLLVPSLPQLRSPSCKFCALAKLASTADAVKDSNSKTYYHRIAGARTHMPDGLEVQFLGGVFTTNDPVVIAELDRVADKLGGGIFTRVAKVCKH